MLPELKIKKAVFANAHRNNVKSLGEADLEYMSSIKAAMLMQSPRGAQMLLWVIVSFVVIFILWSSYAELEEYTRGEGKVVPSQNLQTIQNLEGGILAEFYVREGDRVERGQRLVRIDDTRFASSLRESTLRLEQLSIRSARLRAEAQGEAFIGTGNDELLLERERGIFDARKQELSGNKQILGQQIEQKTQQLQELKAKVEQLEVSVALQRKELRLTEPLVSEGAISEVEVLRLKRKLNDVSGELTAAQFALPRAESELSEIKEKYENLELSFRREAQEALNDTANELARLKESAEALADRVERTQVVSPVAGTVKTFYVTTVGGVIQPGMDIAEVVPSEETLLIEVRVKPADIAYLHPGQIARVMFTAYDFSIMGGLEGELVHISPDSITNDKGESYYLVKVQTSNKLMSPDGNLLPIIPGMTVSVDILTGSKTLLQYLLKPIFKTRQRALRER